MMNLLLTIFSLQMVADGWTTVQVLRFGGYEKDHWIAVLMCKIGVVPALLIAKVAPVAAVWYAISVHQMPIELLGALEVMYIYIIYRNWLALKQQKGLKTNG